DEPLSLPQILDDVERRILTKALKENRGNISKTARSLGVSRQNLQYRLRRQEIELSQIAQPHETGARSDCRILHRTVFRTVSSWKGELQCGTRRFFVTP
ncbi:MAG: helix-turn-helix domain-containing protein, partial [Planctomycetes bacterium]|nr:helix-turn-helix domain-containing protein [Planctomycetota bacterium]